MSIYDVILDDHRKVEKLFDELKRAKDPDARYDCFDRLKEEILAHAKAEESVFYRRLKKGELKEKMADSEEEHHDIEAMLAVIQDIEPSNSRFLKKADDLRELFAHHIREEESQILPKARQIIGKDESDDLARQFQREKAKLQGRGLEPVG